MPTTVIRSVISTIMLENRKKRIIIFTEVPRILLESYINSKNHKSLN